MYAALVEAEKAFEENEVPVGAVIVYNNRIIGRGYNQCERLKDSTAHAEMIAITSSSNHLQNFRLNECELYVTVEPCIMCAGALMLSRIKKIYFGCFDNKFGACGSLYNLPLENKYKHKIEIYSGLLETECKKLLKDFFNLQRKKK